ncbi:MAG: ABC transporter ATP-binding protein, partial [Candidatus Limnocylindrales bacterium]|nr:ABC transporter ATP-binding protein [Candidatus Limnocylindrales bacterium]
MTAGSAAGGGAQGASGAGEPAVLVQGLTKRYGDRIVLDGVSISVGHGELVALLGPNGAGKTTTVEIIEGYRRANGGIVRVLGQDPASGGPQLRARVGLMLQGGGIDPRAQPRETLVQYGRFHANPRNADELLDLVGLRAVARTRYRRLSGGERQRLGLALALVGRPEVLVLDEPTAGMDPEARAATRAIVADLRAAGVAILLTSHDLGDVERMADRVCVLHSGRIVASGTPAELAAGAWPRLRFRLDGPLPGEQLASLGQALTLARPGAELVAEPDAGRYRVEGAAPDAVVIAALADWC